MAVKEQQAVDALIAEREQEKADKKAARKAKFQKKKAKKGKA
jgi:hypothetical protein